MISYSFNWTAMSAIIKVFRFVLSYYFIYCISNRIPRYISQVDRLPNPCILLFNFFLKFWFLIIPFRTVRYLFAYSFNLPIQTPLSLLPDLLPIRASVINFEIAEPDQLYNLLDHIYNTSHANFILLQLSLAVDYLIDTCLCFYQRVIFIPVHF